MPTVSIIVPVYKVEKYLDQCIESIINQTFSDFELILVDDGSPDNCPIMCDEWAKKDGRIKVTHKDNEGVTLARKTGTRVAKGEYITFIDADDYISLDMIEKLIFEAQNSNADYVQCGFAYVWPEKILDVSYKAQEYIQSQIRKDIIPDFIYVNNDTIPGYSWGYICKRLIVEKCIAEVPSDIVIREDRLLMLHILCNIESLYILPKGPCYYYRQRENSAMKTDNKNLENSIKFWKYFIDAANSYGYECGSIEERLNHEFVSDIFSSLYSDKTLKEKINEINILRNRITNKRILLKKYNKNILKQTVCLFVYMYIHPLMICIYELLKKIRGKNV